MYQNGAYRSSVSGSGGIGKLFVRYSKKTEPCKGLKSAVLVTGLGVPSK